MASQTGSYDFKAARQAYIKASSAQDAIDNLEIGGRNLILRSKDFTMAESYWRPSGPGYWSRSLDADGNTVMTCTKPSSVTSADWPRIIPHKYFTKEEIDKHPEGIKVSFDFKVVNKSLIDHGCIVALQAYNSSSSRIGWYEAQSIVSGKDTNLSLNEIQNNVWTRVVVSFSQSALLIHNGGSYTEADVAFTQLSFQLNKSPGCEISIRLPKAEYGNAPTDWTPAPEDLEASIESVNERSVEYIVGTQTAATGSWTGVTTDSELKTGKTIAYKLPYAGSGNASLTLTLSGGSTTAAIPVYLSNTRVTTHFPANSIIQMTYDGANWRATAIPDNNTYDRVRLNNAITAATAITANRIICGTDSGYKNTATEVSFDLGYPLLFAASEIAANATGTNNYLSFPGPTATNNGTVESGAAKKTLYLKGTVSGNMFTIAESPFMTTVVPTTEDGFFYIPLGVMYDATHIYFESTNRLYAYVNGSFQAVDVAGQILAIQSINRLNSLEPIVEQHSANFDVLQDSIMSNVEANYTRADEFNTYVDSQHSSLEQLSNSITAQFNESRELISSVNGNLETYKDDISKYIRFSAEGIEIGEEGNALTLKVDNDEIGFYKEGDQIAYWDGSTLYTGNAWITLERQFRIGNFAAIPRSDGSVSWLKVGE